MNLDFSYILRIFVPENSHQGWIFGSIQFIKSSMHRYYRHFVAIMCLYCLPFCLLAQGKIDSGFPQEVLQTEPPEQWIQRGLSPQINSTQILQLGLLLSNDPVSSNDERYKKWGMAFKGRGLMARGEADKADSLFQACEEYATRVGYDSLLAYCYNARGVLEISLRSHQYLALKNFYDALDAAKRADFQSMQAIVACNFAELSLLQGNILALDLAKDCLNYGRHNDPFFHFAGAFYCASLHQSKGENEKAMEYLKECFEVNRTHPNRLIVHAKLLEALILADNRKYDEANRCIADIKSSIEDTTIIDDTNLSITINEADILSQQGHYSSSNRKLHWILTSGYNSFNQRCYKALSSNFRQMGRLDSAMYYQQLYVNEKDSLYTISREQMASELYTAYHVEKLQQHANDQKLRYEREAGRNRLLTLSLVGLLLILLVITFYIRQRQSLYRHIVSQYRDSIQRESILRRQIADITRAENDTVETQQVSEDKISDAKQEKSFRALCQLIEDERLYADPQISRDNLAERLGTNRTYLSKLINDMAGKNYSQFINSYRIQEAVKFLSDPLNEDYPLKQLCFNLGFTSLSTFYKTFTETVGIPPSVYRQTALKMK